MTPEWFVRAEKIKLEHLSVFECILWFLEVSRGKAEDDALAGLEVMKVWMKCFCSRGGAEVLVSSASVDHSERSRNQGQLKKALFYQTFQ